MRPLEVIKHWFEAHSPWGQPPSAGRWYSTSSVVRETALDLTHQRIVQQTEEIEETLQRLRTEVEVLRGRGGEHDGNHSDAAG